MSDYNEITATITTEEPAVAATLDELRYLVLQGKAGKAPRVSATTGNWEVYDNDIEDWADTGISASTDITPEQLAEAIEHYFDEHPIDIPTDAVLYTPQSLTPAQQEQARGNIGAGTYTKPSGGIPDSDIASAATWNAKYTKPASGIPASDLASGVIPSVPQMATQADMSDWTSGKTVDAAVLKADFITSVLAVDNLEVKKADKTDIPTAVSELTNDSGFVNASEAAAAAPVQSVNGQTGAVTIPTGNPNAVLYTPQSLTPEQQEQARENIGIDYMTSSDADELWGSSYIPADVDEAEAIDKRFAALEAEAADIESLRPKTFYSGTLTGTGVPSFSVSIPAGTYDLTIDGITSSDTDDTRTVVAFRNGNTAVQTKTFDRGTAISQSITFGSDIDNILVYASTSWPKSQGDTVTISGLTLSVETALNSAVTELRTDSKKIARADTEVSDLTGRIDLSGTTVTSKQKNAPLAHLNVTKSAIYGLSAKLASAVSVNSYVFLYAADGTQLNSWMIASGATEVSGRYTAQNDYPGAYLAVSSSATVEFETLRLDFDGQLSSNLLPHNATILSVENENSAKQRDVLYSAESIVIETADSAYNGVELEFIRPALGTVIEPVFERNVGNNSKFKIELTDTSGASTTFYDEPVVVRANTQRVVVTLIACWGTALATGTEVTFSNVRIMSRVVDGEGDKVYTGDRIVLKDDSKLNRCGIDLWADYKVADIPTLANYKLHMNQSMTIYKGNVFLFNDGGTGCVVDYSNKEILSSFSFEPATDNHANSAQFTDIYYDSADEYPLMILSRCYGAGEDECLIYRVLESGGAFTFTLVNSISLNLETTYGMSWGVDNTSHKLYCAQHLNGNFQVTENNPFHYHVFDMPTRSEIISGTPIVLSLADAVTHMTVDERVVSQGMTVNGGVIYQGMQVGSGKIAHIWAVDPAKNRVLSRIPLTSQLEPEGVAIYGGRMYVSQKRGSDSSATNPLQIYELSF